MVSPRGTAGRKGHPMTDTIRLQAWAGPWPDDDPDANFKTQVELFSKLDPLDTLRPLSENLDIPLGALVRSILARWAAEGSAAALELGPSMCDRLWAAVEKAED